MHRAVALVLFTALAAACGGDDLSIAVRPEGESFTVPDGTTAPMDALPGPGIDWEDCGRGLECGTLDVPLDHAQPDGDTIELYVQRHLADGDRRIGSLLVNPGGPGVPGSQLAEQASFYFSDALLDRFDIVAIDPRGTGLSAPIDCVDDLDPFFGDPDPTPDDEAERAELDSVVREMADTCEVAMGDLLAHVSTQDTARDLELVRQALGEDQISWFGFSYGSELGATYATLFPGSVRSMVLDGAVNPNDDDRTGLRDQVIGLEETLGRLLAACSADDDCAFHSDGDAERAFDELLASLDDPIPSDDPDRPVGQGVAFWSVIQVLYAEQLWPLLYNALADAAEGDGQGMLELYDSYFGRAPDGDWDDTLEANIAIGCLDDSGPTDPAELDELRAEMASLAPRIGPYSIDPDFCQAWPVPSVEPLTITAAGAGPILVLGATGDPITTLPATRRLADALEDGVLLVREGEGHTSYGAGLDCIDNAVDDYLIDLTLPEDGTVCG